MVKKHIPNRHVSPEAPAKSRAVNRIVTAVTLFVALWGAVLSTWVYMDQRQSSAPKIYVRMDVQAAGYDQSNTPVGDVQVLFLNVGKEGFSISPRVDILAIDSRTGKKVGAIAGFERNRPTDSRPQLLVLPVTLKPGEEALAQSSGLALSELVNSLDYAAVTFELSGGSRWIARFNDPDYLTWDANRRQLTGWSGGGLAERIK